jgi:methylase of polypeptide subunit release factors
MKLMARIKTKAIAEFGDFQTPAPLAEKVCALLAVLGVEPASIVEPTCGRGAFIFAAADRWPSAAAVVGLDLNPSHLSVARQCADLRSDASRIRIECSDFFTTDWPALVRSLPDPILLVGNPPWVTNADVARLGGSNVPAKSNFQGHNGLDAITGKANFDISEWMLIKLAEALNRRDGVLGMLVKTAVARKMLFHYWKSGQSFADASIYRIDAAAHFDAAVDASLVVLKFGRQQTSARAHVYGQLSQAIPPVATIGLVGDTLIADLDAYEQAQHLGGGSSLKWRSGIKHDCSKVMELRAKQGQLRNGLGEIVELETDFLLPMLKTSEVAGGKGDTCTRWMVVPQRRIGASTAEIAEVAPKTWAYLQSHLSLFARRQSSIYRGRPEFSIFGVGAYSFSPWKVAISGMYKVLRFVKVGPYDGKPVVFDDTTNFLPCPSEASATLLLSMLESSFAKTFYRAFVFWDSKRPITVELLARLNLHALAAELGALREFESHFGSAFAQSGKQTHPHRAKAPPLTLWPA